MNDLYFHCYCVDFSVNAYEMRMKKVFFFSGDTPPEKKFLQWILKIAKTDKTGNELNMTAAAQEHTGPQWTNSTKETDIVWTRKRLSAILCHCYVIGTRSRGRQLKTRLANVKQEAQLSQRDRAMLHVIEYSVKSFKVTQGHLKWQCWVERKTLFVPVFHCTYLCISYPFSEIFSIKEWRDIETGDRSRLRSLKMAPFDRWYTTFYWSAIVI